uniref:Uncharacterized protein n=1 Tax=candidate division WWE3 bacterium TaxID=2053526 RepID=A0A7C4TRC9_UNCKA
MQQQKVLSIRVSRPRKNRQVELDFDVTVQVYGGNARREGGEVAGVTVRIIWGTDANKTSQKKVISAGVETPSDALSFLRAEAKNIAGQPGVGMSYTVIGNNIDTVFRTLWRNHFDSLIAQRNSRR